MVATAAFLSAATIAAAPAAQAAQEAFQLAEVRFNNNAMSAFSAEVHAAMPGMWLFAES